jgi:hypothetical protein
MRRSLTGYAAAAILMFSAVAQSLPSPALAEDVTVWGQGNILCSDWNLKNRSDSESRQWVVGFLVGESAAFGQDLLKDTNMDAIFKQIDQICAVKVSLTLAKAAQSVSRELRK